jgi:hypothetical protein
MILTTELETLQVHSISGLNGMLNNKWLMAQAQL